MQKPSFEGSDWPVRRLIFDLSLAVGMLAFAASLWGIPSAKQLGISILFGICSAFISFVLMYSLYALYERFRGVKQTKKEHTFTPQRIQGKPYAERSLDEYTLSVNSITENERTIISGFTPKPTPAFPKKWSVNLIETLEWRVFDKLCIAYWRMKGNGMVRQSQNSLSGVNSYITSPPVTPSSNSKMGVILAVLQTRSAQSTSISVQEMQNLVKLKQQKQLPLAILMYAGKLSNVVSSFCESNQIKLIDANALYKGIKSLSKQQQKKLLDSLIRPDYMIPTCPSCEVKLVKRKRKDNGRVFWGCISYPECRFNMDYVAHF